MSAVVIAVAVILLLVACAAVLMAFLLPGKTGSTGPIGPTGAPGGNVAGLFPTFPNVVAGGSSATSINTLYYYGTESAVKTVAVPNIALTGVLVIANATGGDLAVSFADGSARSLPTSACFYVSVFPGAINVQQYAFST